MSLIFNFSLAAALTTQKVQFARSSGKVYAGTEWPKHVVELTIVTPTGTKTFNVPSWGEKK